MLRKTAFATLLSSVFGADETSLMQALKPGSGVQRRNPTSLSNLLESAGTLLKNGATPDVVEFARATLEEISGIVIPAIEHASIVDQQLLEDMFARFEFAENELEEGIAEIHHLSAHERAQSAAHKTCRDQEEEKCTTKITCDYDIYELWKTFIDEERDLRIKQHDITGHFCTDKNGTQTSFRHESVPKMESFSSQWTVVMTSEEFYDDKHPECESKFLQLDSKTEECDALQGALEEAACEHATTVRRVRVEFYAAWNDAVQSYSATVCDVRAKQADRIVEFQTLSVVQCLLDRTTEHNGRPCDESTDEAFTEMTHCEQVRTTVDINWLILTYWDIPSTPQVCVNQYHADYVQGRCIPEPPNFPCSAGFKAAEYDVLPAVPQAEFHSENSHCNQRPDCQNCIAMELAEPVLVIVPEAQCAVPGDGPIVICCEAMTADCQACAAGQTVGEYCGTFPDTQGCVSIPEPQPWSLILKYGNEPYTPTSAAVDNGDTFSKLSDADINALPSGGDEHYDYYKLTSDSADGSNRDRIMLRVTGAYDDMVANLGLVHADVCNTEAETPGGCTDWFGGVANVHDGLDTVQHGGNDCDRWFTGYSGTVRCYSHDGIPNNSNERCFSHGNSCSLGAHAMRTNVVVSKYTR